MGLKEDNFDWIFALFTLDNFHLLSLYMKNKHTSAAALVAQDQSGHNKLDGFQFVTTRQRILYVTLRM